MDTDVLSLSLALIRFEGVFVGCSAGAGVRFCGKFQFTSKMLHSEGTQAQGIELGPFGGGPRGLGPHTAA